MAWEMEMLELWSESAYGLRPFPVLLLFSLWVELLFSLPQLSYVQRRQPPERQSPSSVLLAMNLFLPLLCRRLPLSSSGLAVSSRADAGT